MAEKTSEGREPLLHVKGMNVTGRALIVGVLLVALVWFVAANTQSVKVRLWVPTVTAPLWLVLAVTAVVSGAIGWFVGRRRLRNKGRRN
ncbi:LapA family protein [Streptacidiphilus jiangxiensis]|uniref:Lipopolysaccharide assembly protein A domain-containing protein n=1 Tax=Streptacidiphilus jiangxiensis TaxID=235985 RepID=A0A1H7YXI2_STRJI|nr:LapA family protein [Streptacidiphilus jiangxiensis]SEM50655.1 Protein of unknown function [Streptacidiphilus jiangxiensis]